MITHEKLLTVLDYDPLTGVFRWKEKHWKMPAGSVAGSRLNGGTGWYWRIRVLGTVYLAHRLAWFYMHGSWPKHEIDHVNRDGLDNRIANLREANRVEQLGNTRAPNHNTSGVKGVSWNNRMRKWRAFIKINGKHTYLGSFEEKEAAAAAYAEAARKHFGQFART